MRYLAANQPVEGPRVQKMELDPIGISGEYDPGTGYGVSGLPRPVEAKLGEQSSPDIINSANLSRVSNATTSGKGAPSTPSETSSFSKAASMGSFGTPELMAAGAVSGVIGDYFDAKQKTRDLEINSVKEANLSRMRAADNVLATLRGNFV